MPSDKEIEVSLTPTDGWLEPVVPPNISAIIKEPEANATWQKTTPRARREWLRWINATPVLLQSRQLHRAGCRKKW